MTFAAEGPLTVSDFELYALTFSQSFETVGLDCREVYEYIFAAIFRSNETESFDSLNHLTLPLILDIKITFI